MAIPSLTLPKRSGRGESRIVVPPLTPPQRGGKGDEQDPNPQKPSGKSGLVTLGVQVNFWFANFQGVSRVRKRAFVRRLCN